MRGIRDPRKPTERPRHFARPVQTTMIDSADNFLRVVTSEKLAAIYKVWKALARDRIGPRRAELTPAHLRKMTPWTFTVEVVDSGKDFRFGFAGEQVMQFLDRRCDAPTLAGMLDNPFFGMADDLMRRCLQSKKPLVSGPRRTQYAGKEYLEREVMLLPLSEDGQRVTGMLGAFDTWLLGTHPHRAEPVLAD